MGANGMANGASAPRNSQAAAAAAAAVAAAESTERSRRQKAEATTHTGLEYRGPGAACWDSPTRGRVIKRRAHFFVFFG